MEKILVTIFFCLLALIPPAQAAEKLSTSEDVAIAFFKTGGVTPDFSRWALQSEKHATVPKTREKEYLAKEISRMRTLWDGYDPANSLISLKAMVNVALATALDEKGVPHHSMTLSFEKGAADYFPFVFQDYMIAVVPQKLNQLMVQSLPPEQFNLLQTEFNGKWSGRGLLYFQLKPVKADTSRPYEMDGHEQWMLVADVAGLSLKNSQGTSLWNYSAPWYVTPTTMGVRDMYTRQEEKERADDAAEGIAP